jgi:cell wall assembly regulator SMI1
MTSAYAANQVRKLPSEIKPGDFVYDHGRWVPVDHVDTENGLAVIHLAPIRCTAAEPVAVCTAH